MLSLERVDVVAALSPSSDLRIPDGTEGRDASAHHSVDDLLGKGLIGNDGNSFSVEFLDEPKDQLDHVGLSMFSCVLKWC